METATKGDLAAYVQDLVTRPKPHGQQIIHLHSGHGLSDQTIQLRLTATRLYYDHLVEIGQRTRNPVGRGKYTRRNSFSVVRHPTPADERPLVRRKPARQPWIPSDEQFKILLAALAPESLRNQALFLLMYDGALRREEVVLLELADIDWAHREVTLRPEICKNGSGAWSSLRRRRQPACALIWNIAARSRLAWGDRFSPSLTATEPRASPQR